jgi:uncharacterized RDD family membrane protein YckC
MTTKIEFETPENVLVAYEPAGLGTRFVAWFVDNLILIVIYIAVFFALMIAGIATESVARAIDSTVENATADKEETQEVVLYFLGMFLLIWGIGSFFYYGCCEYLMRGQTPGKRLSRIRVVRLDGFSLEAGSIFARSIFRVIDHLPPLWVVPLVSAKSQRLGDMVAGTAVVSDRQEAFGGIRDQLAMRKPTEARFSFDAARLKRARPQDFAAIEKILSRWNQLNDTQRAALLQQIIPALAARLQTDVPSDEEALQYLTDLLAAEYRRQHRHLG